MKRFDYLCSLYCVLLLVFGFEDKAAPNKLQSTLTSDTQAHIFLPKENQEKARRYRIGLVPASTNVSNNGKRLNKEHLSQR